MLELRDFLHIFRRRFIFVLWGLVIGLGVGIGVAWRASQGVSGVFMLSLARDVTSPISVAQRFTYDGYYLVETSRLFGDRLGDFLASELFAERLRSRVPEIAVTQAQRRNQQDIALTVHAPTVALLEKGKDGSVRIASDFLNAQAQKTGEPLAFSAVAAPLAEVSGTSPYAFAALGAGFGLVLGALAAFFREYLKQN